MTMKKLILILVPLALIMSGCNSNEYEKNTSSKVKGMLSQKLAPVAFEKVPTPAFISIKEPQDLKLAQKVNVSVNQPINIIAAIDFADNSLSVSPDSGVDLSKKFHVKFNNQTLSRYFDYLQNITGYSVELNNGIVYIKSIQSKTWNLQTLSINNTLSLTSSNPKSNFKSKSKSGVKSNYAWMNIVNQVKSIVSSDGDNKTIRSNRPSKSQEKKRIALVMHNQQQGTISAIALPSKIKAVDAWLGGLIKSSNRQVHLQVQVLDVIVDESVGRGIDWSLISQQSSAFKIESKSKQEIKGSGYITLGTPESVVLDLGKKITLGAMLNFLRKQGKVKVDNQPNITVTNGREAYITTGDEFSYISSIESEKDAQGQVSITAEVQRMNVGVDMRVTPKILPDNRIVVDIVPIISSIKSFSTLTSGVEGSVQEFQTPNIALQKLTTQVIVESGRTIHLGGLIASKIASAVKGLPSDGIMNFFFRGVKKSLERREIVILITPTIVK